MQRRSLVVLLAFAWILIGVRFGWAQYDVGAAGTISNLGNLGSLNPGVVGGGGTIPGAILVKITGEVYCLSCTLEEMNLEETPGDLYQFSHENTHLVIKVTKAAPDIAWGMVERHKLFLAPGEDPSQLKRFLSDSQPGKRIEVTGGVAPEAGSFIPISVKVK
jgi:hypothetical protein